MVQKWPPFANVYTIENVNVGGYVDKKAKILSMAPYQDFLMVLSKNGLAFLIQDIFKTKMKAEYL